ncbi:MAG TPA: AbrB/MazE/SpoVT family DNA-binding domain-containing protein [Syntrophaceae bacterium]|nr:AbrB/MazE/SpoVT family DNA-binding domain-containing protein [Syntrophaceae bacterium]
MKKGQIVIPKEAREKANIRPGDKVEVKVTKEGIVILPLKKGSTESFKGLVKGKLTLKELDKLYAEKS